MSMNLFAENNGVEINLWQTPTWVTYMCIDSYKQDKHSGNPLQRKWKDTRHLYLEWVKSHSQGRWDSEVEWQEMVDNIKEHVDNIMSIKKIHFTVG